MFKNNTGGVKKDDVFLMTVGDLLSKIGKRPKKKGLGEP